MYKVQCSEAGTLGLRGRGLRPVDVTWLLPPSSAEAQPSRLIDLHPIRPAAFSSASNPPASWFDEDTPLSQSPWLPVTCRPGLQDPLSPLPTSPHHIDWTPHSPSTQTQMRAPHTHPYVPPPGVFTFPPFESLSVPNAPSPGRFPTPQRQPVCDPLTPWCCIFIALMGPLNTILPSFPPSPPAQCLHQAGSSQLCTCEMSK